MLRSIDDLVSMWHELDTGVELHEFLGMNWEEYGFWIEGKIEESKDFVEKANRAAKRILKQMSWG